MYIVVKSSNNIIPAERFCIKKGKIVNVGADITVPNDAVEIDLAGKFIYPSFIDLYTNYGMPKPKAVGTRPKKQPQMVSNKKHHIDQN